MIYILFICCSREGITCIAIDGGTWATKIAAFKIVMHNTLNKSEELAEIKEKQQ